MNKETIDSMRKNPDPEAETARLELLLAHLGQLLGDEAERRAFRQCARTPPPVCLRLNRLLPQSQLLRPFLAGCGRQVPWCPDAFTLRQTEGSLGRTLEFVLGAFYLQAKAATLAVEVLDPGPGERVLDLCAAPGGKATQIAGRMGNTGLLLVNEPMSRRLPSLVGHLERCGAANAILSKASGALLARYFHNYFDRVLVDAPCSGDGLFRKDLSMLRYWSVDDARRQAQIQTGLLRAAFHMLRPGGILVYSTCSLSLEENEEVLLSLLGKFPDQAEILPVAGFAAPPLPPRAAGRFPAAFTRCVRVWPHLHDTEGAFVARLGKRGPTEWHTRAGDAGTWEAEGRPGAEAAAAREQLEKQWRFAFPCPGDHLLSIEHRHLWLRPRAAEAFQTHYPFYVRGGMRVGRNHKGHYYLSQQAVAMWGSDMQSARLELDWPQVRTLFQGRPVELPDPSAAKGEVLCSLGPWIVCRAIVRADGITLQGMVPRGVYRPDLTRLDSMPPSNPDEENFSHKNLVTPI
jgi:16S rRNA (cytosine1407-C5)-methyltransferase